MKKMKVLVIGSGGREDAIAQQIKQSQLYDVDLYVAPGNAGTAGYATNVALKATDINGLLAFAKDYEIDLTIVGPEQPLADGIVDVFREAGLEIFGPTQAAAALEWSKEFAKEMMAATGVPTAAYRTFTDFDSARQYIEGHSFPLVIKADGLAGGKGAVVCYNASQAGEVLLEMLVDKSLGAAGSKVIIEDCLVGQEISLLVMCDGTTHRSLITAQDHKALGKGDTGPNTGGMGAIAPVPWVGDGMLQYIEKAIVAPILAGMSLEGNPFTGCLYVGLMITEEGPYVLEFNVRFGDPETQAVLPLMKSDFLELINACVDGTLESYKLEWYEQYAACVVLAAGEYPGKCKVGFPVTGLVAASKVVDTTVYHAGTVYDPESGQVKTNGGRVFGVTGVGLTLSDAIKKAYRASRLIEFEGKKNRPDIGDRAPERTKS